MKYFITYSYIVFVLCLPVFAQTRLRDVPDGHYAYEAVYDLIKQGITDGYPDGTYRGKKLMTRYEIAGFIAKFANSKNLARGQDEKLVEELKTEVGLAGYEHEQARRETQVGGGFVGRWSAGDPSGSRIARADYRLQAFLRKNFSDRAGLQIDLDTLDAGYGGGQRDLVRDLIAVEGTVGAGANKLTVTSGPGEVVSADNVLPIGNGQVFFRPWRALYLSSAFRSTEFAVGCLSRSSSAVGTTEALEINAKLSQQFAPITVSLMPRLFSNPAGERDLRFELSGAAEMFSMVRLGLLAGTDKLNLEKPGLFIRGDLVVGEQFRLIAQKIGSQYREKFSYTIPDIFNRNILDGNTSFGASLDLDLWSWYLRLKGDLTNPGDNLSKEFGFGKKMAVGELGLFYQALNQAQAAGCKVQFKY